MKIKKVSTWKENLGLTRPYTIAYERVEVVENLFVLIEPENGLVGIGADSPDEHVTGENIKACEEVLNQELDPNLAGSDIRHYKTLLRRLAAVMPAAPAALAAADIALHDLLAQSLNLPLVEVLGRVHEALPTSKTIGIKSVDETLAEAEEYLRKGFETIKVKVGHDVDEDIERLIRLRERYGAEVTLRAGGITQHRRVHPSRGYLSQVELPVTFGLGAATRVDELSVTWPGGRVQQVAVPRVDRMITITQEVAR